MNDREIDERIAEIRACKHNQRHYRDEYGNRRCAECDGHVRPVTGVSICAPPKRDGR